jgi:hypothetical protein
VLINILKKKKIVIAFGGVLLVILVLLIFKDNTVHVGQPQSVSIRVTPHPPIKEPNGKTRIILDAVNASGRDGWVLVQENEGKVWFNINIEADENPEDDHDFPATLRSGSCSNLGDVRHTLVPAFNGGSETTLNMSLADFRASLPLSLVVEQSPTEPKIVACGDIRTVYY